MNQHATRTLLAAVCLFAATGAAHADVFTWNPAAVGLNGAAFTADTLVLGDHARIAFGPDGATFTDTGYMPVLGFTLAGQTLAPPGFGAADGTGWGAYVRYSAAGAQTWLAPGVPDGATFTRMSYEIAGYNGLAAFSFDADGNPAVGGTRGGITSLGTGALVAGGLAFGWGSPAGPTISGDAAATIGGVPPGFSDDAPSGFDVAFLHPPGDYAFTPAGALEISDGAGHSAATFPTGGAKALGARLDGAAPASVEVPEPGTAALVGAGLLCLGLLCRPPH